MSGDGTDRNGAGEPDESADGTDWLLSQLDEDETGAIETQPEAAAPETDPAGTAIPATTEPVVRQPAEDERTQVLPVVADEDSGPVPTAPSQSVPSFPTPTVPTPAVPTPAVPTTVEQAPADQAPADQAAAQSAPGAPSPTAPAAAGPGEFASEAELLEWWQSQVTAEGNAGGASDPAPVDQPPADSSPADSSPADSSPEQLGGTPADDASVPPRRHPNALELPVVPPTPAPAAPVPPVLNELTVDTDSVLQHAPAGTFRPAPTSPVVVPPVDDQPWSLGGADDDEPHGAPEDVATAALPIARALAANDPAAWATVDAEQADTETSASPRSTPETTPELPRADAPASDASLGHALVPATAAPAAEDEQPSGPSVDAPAAVGDDDLPDGSWSLSQTFGDDVLDGEIVEIRQTDEPAAADAAAERASDGGTSTDETETETETAGETPEPVSEPRTDPLAWLTEPFGDTFGAAPAAAGTDATDTDTDTDTDATDTASTETASVDTFDVDAADVDAADVDAADAGTADVDAPDVETPGSALSGSVLSDSAVPDAALSDSAVPDAALPDTALPDTALPDTAGTDSAGTEGMSTETPAPDAPSSPSTGGPATETASIGDTLAQELRLHGDPAASEPGADELPPAQVPAEDEQQHAASGGVFEPIVTDRDATAVIDAFGSGHAPEIVEPETVVEPEPEPKPAPERAALRWDSPAPAEPAKPAEPASPADVPWPDAAPEDDADPLNETRPFDSLGGPGFLAGAAGAGAAGEALSAPSAPTPMPSPFSTTPASGTDRADDDSAQTVPAAFGPPPTTPERSITELISLDGVVAEPAVSPFGDEPFVWDLAPNDALDPLVHAAPTTQPIPVPPVQWEATEPGEAVSAESPSELALEGEVPDAAFIAGDVQPFAPGLAAETLGRPLVDGPGDAFSDGTASDTIADDTEASVRATAPTPASPTATTADDTVDLFPTLSLGGLDASAAGAAAAGISAGAVFPAAADLSAGADGATEDDEAGSSPAEAPKSIDGAAETAPPAGAPSFAIDPEELDDEFDEEIVQFDAIPLSASGVAPLESFVPEGAAPAETAEQTSSSAEPSDALPSDALPTDAVPTDAAAAESVTPEPTEPAPVSEELRLESLFDLGPDTDLVDVVEPDEVADDAPAVAHDAQPDVPNTTPAPTESTAPDAGPATASATSLADAFAAEGGWSLGAEPMEAPELPLAPVPGLVAADGTATSLADAESVSDTTVAGGAQPDATEQDAATHDMPSDASSRPPTPAFGSVLGSSAVAAPSHAPVPPAPQTAPAALPGETVAFPELDGAAALGDAAPAAGVVGATLPPQVVQTSPQNAPQTTPQADAVGRDLPERDLPVYRGDPGEQGIPKALLWTVVGLGAAVLLLLAFYFGTLVGAAGAGASGSGSVTTPAAAAVVASTGSASGVV